MMSDLTKAVIRYLSCCLMLCATSATAADAQTEAAPIRIAILSGEGERAPSDEMVALVEVAASKQDDVTLLERAEIRKIMREQKLSASDLSDPRTAVRLGELLSVEMFIFLDSIPKTKPVACRIQVIETKTGIALTGSIDEQQHLIDTPEDLTKTIQLAFAKQRISMDHRHYVGILGVRNEEPGHLLDGLATAFEMFLATDLAKSPDIILLDREHLRWLREEKALTDIAQQLKVSSVLIEGSLRRDKEADKMILKLDFRALSNGTPQTHNIAFSDTNIGAARRHATTVVTEQMKASPLSDVSADAAAEAALFLDQARFLTRIAYDEDALRASAAAYALNPTEETRLALARTFARFVLPRHLFVRAPEPEDKIRSLNMEIRYLSLMCEQYRLTYPLQDDPVQASETPRLHRLVPMHTGLGLVFSDETGEVRRLQKEVADLRREILDHFITYSQKDFESRQHVYCGAVRHALEQLHLGDRGHAESKVQGLRQILQYFTSPPGNIRDEPPEGDNLIDNIVHIPSAMQAYRAGDKAEPKDRAAFVQFFDEMQSHPKTEVRLMAYGAFVCMDEKALASAYAVRDILLAEYRPPDLPRRMKPLLMYCVLRVAADKPTGLNPYCEPLIGPCLGKDGDGEVVMGWGSVIEHWIEGLERSDQIQEADVLANRVLQALRRLQAERPDWNPVATNRFASQLEVKRAKYAKKLDRTPDLPEPWSKYTLKPLPLTDLGTFIPSALLLGDRLHCLSVQHGAADHEHNATLLTYRFPEGGDPFSKIQFTLPNFNYSSISHGYVSDMTASPDAAYIGTSENGLIEIVLSTGDVRHLTEVDGLPSNSISALAWYDGKLYMGLGDPDQHTSSKNGLAVFDPKTCQSHILTSAADRTSSGLVKISRLISDEKRQCIWIGSPDWGVWRYDPKTDTMEHKVKTGGYAIREFSGIQPLPNGGEGLLLWNIMAGFVLFDFDTCQTTWLAGHPKHRAWDCKGSPLMPPPGALLPFPVAYFEGDLVTGHTYLTLHSEGLPEAANPAVLQPRSFIVTPHGLFMTVYGKAMLLQRTRPSEIKTGANNR